MRAANFAEVAVTASLKRFDLLREWIDALLEDAIRPVGESGRDRSECLRVLRSVLSARACVGRRIARTESPAGREAGGAPQATAFTRGSSNHTEDSIAAQ
jgi:hypothetical protein